MKKLSVLLSLLFIIVAGGFLLSSETRVRGQGDIGWKVWVKTSPCSGRNDWVSVAKENPTYGGGAGIWSNADLIITGTGMNCVSNSSESCSFAAANAEAAIVRASDSFSNYCCKEYSVWENSQTRQRTVVQGKLGTAGYPWRTVAGPMCCSEAEALAGVSGACSGSQGGRTGWGSIDHQSSLQGETLTYYGGTTPEKCQMDCDGNPRCRAFTFIRQGAYNPNDPPMCYLISKVTASARHSCCISAVKGAGGAGGGNNRGRRRSKITGKEIDGGIVDDDGNTNDGGGERDGGRTNDNQKWAGSWIRPDGVEALTVSGGTGGIQAAFEYQGNGFSGRGQWTNCRVSGNTAECNWTASHDDDTKRGIRRGTLRMTLNGNTISGSYFEDTPQWSWKPGYGPHNVTSSMFKGAVFNPTYNRRY